jgi:cytochrome c-type protein NapB
MKKTISAVLMAAVMVLGVGQISAEQVKSLRGAKPLDVESSAPDMKRVEKDSAPIARNYIQQPPLIAHSIRGYQITRKNNKCLDCHSWENYREFGATKVSQTHFTNREGIDLADVSPNRYFCTQCHVVQADAQPLVKNEFKPVEALK